MLDARPAKTLAVVVGIDHYGYGERWPELVTAAEAVLKLPDLTVLEKIDGEPPWETARRAAARWGQIVVLKGPFTAVAARTGPVYVYPHANSALATAGTGDVLEPEDGLIGIGSGGA